MGGVADRLPDGRGGGRQASSRGEPKRGQENSDRRLTDAEICKNFNISGKEAVGKVRLIEKEVGRKSISENDGIAWSREGQEEREGRGEQGRGSREQWGQLTPQLGRLCDLIIQRRAIVKNHITSGPFVNKLNLKLNLKLLEFRPPPPTLN